MLSQIILSTSLILGSVLAQTPDGIPFTTTKNLQVAYGSRNISTPGILMNVQDVTTQPDISTAAPLEGTYTIIMIDPDARINGSTIEVLHWAQSNLKSSSVQSKGSYPLVVSGNTSAIAPYVPPGPPAEVPARAHRYIELLFKQPGNVVVPPEFSETLKTRLGMNIAKFVPESGLGALVAANYFTVTNTTLSGPAATTGATPTFTGVQFPNVASGLGIAKETMGLIAGIFAMGSFLLI